MFIFLAVSSSWSQVSLGKCQSILLIPWKSSIYATMATLPIFPLGKRKDDCVKMLIVQRIAHRIYLIIDLLLCWSPFDNHLHGLRFIYVFLFQMSSLQIFQWHAFGVTDHPVNPLSTAHGSVNNCIAGHFFFQTKCNIMHTFWSSAQHDDFPSLILWLFQKMLQCCWFLGVSCVICGAIKSNGI